MPEEKDFDYVVGKLPRRDKDGNDTTGDRIGKGGRHRDDGTYSAVAYDLEVVDEDPTKKAPEPTVIVQREVVEVEKQPTRYADLPWYGQLICDGIEMVMPYVVDGLVNLTERGINTGISAVKRKAAAKREKCVQQKKEVTAHIEPSESAQMATTPEKATTILDEIDAAYENYSINATNQLKSFKANLFSLTWAQRMPSDTEIKDTLKTLKIYSLSSSRTKTILDKLENNRRKEYVPTSEYTIEHIMPQTLSDDWKSDLGADANRIHETYVHTIGNLTLTGYNSEYQNKRFSDKVDCTDKAGNAIGYRHTPIRISSYLTTVSKWGEAEILARAEMLWTDGRP